MASMTTDTPRGMLASIGLKSRVAIDALTHMLPFIPNFHLNKDAGLTRHQYYELVQRADEILSKWNLKIYD